jgi:ferredoxin-NADP reductase
MTEATASQPARWQQSTITAIRPLTPRVTSFSCRPSQPFAWQAGQHVDVRLTAPDGYTAQRSYSIASAPEAAESIELAIEKLDNGEVSPFFHEVAAVGDEIELRGPLGGHFVWNAAESIAALLVGGGSGVVPLVSMARHHAASGSKAPMILLCSARSWDDICFRDELISLDAMQNGLRVVFATTRQTAQRPGDYSRRIDPTMIKEVIALMPSPPTRAYLCGSNAFVSAASDAAIGSDLPSSMIRTERYGE